MRTNKTIIKDYNELMDGVKSSKPLSELMPSLLILAKTINNLQLTKWTQLEMSSYFNSNPELTKEVTVPEYRIVSGQYHDTFNRPVIITDPSLSFVNQIRLRQGVGELEKLSSEKGLLKVQDVSSLSLIEKNFGVQVSYFSFPSTAINGVLSSIRNELINKLLAISSEVEQAGRGNGESIHTHIHQYIDNLHPLVKSVSSHLFADGHYRQAILDTYILLTDTVKTKSGRHDLDGSALMQTVFSAKSPTIKVSDDPDEQLGFMWMFSGAVMGIRNPKAHKLIPQTDPQRTLEWLSFASVLLRVLDDSQVIKTSNGT